jgi:hypothetical protein
MTFPLFSAGLRARHEIQLFPIAIYGWSDGYGAASCTLAVVAGK